MNAVEMPDRVAGDLVMFTRQNKGTLSKGRRDGEFQQLRDDEVSALERIVRDAFEGFDEGASEPRAAGAVDPQRPRLSPGRPALGVEGIETRPIWRRSAIFPFTTSRCAAATPRTSAHGRRL